jgi:hypothetical protein
MMVNIVQVRYIGPEFLYQLPYLFFGLAVIKYFPYGFDFIGKGMLVIKIGIIGEITVPSALLVFGVMHGKMRHFMASFF